MLGLALSRAIDPSLFAQDLGLELDPWQSQLLREQPRRALLNCSRQSGKSTICAVLSLYRAIFFADSLIVIISPSMRQSNEMIRSIRRLHGNLRPGTTPKLLSDTTSKLELENGSRVLGLPGGDSDGRTIRGISGVHLLICAEAARIPDELFQATRPMTATTNGSIILLSTPAGRRGAFFELWHSNDASWTKVRVAAEDCPRISDEFLAEERRELGETRFSEEYGLQFLDPGEQALRT